MTPIQAFYILRRRFAAVVIPTPIVTPTQGDARPPVVTPTIAKGDQADMLARLRALLPNGWFSGSSPVLDTVLSGLAWALAQVYALIAYARLQTRLATATDGFLDLIAFDFFGQTLPRKSQESDPSFRKRIQAQLLIEKGTRTGLIKSLTLLTGRAPLVFEPTRGQDTGYYDTPTTMGYDVAGAYGEYDLNHQAFVIAYRPTTSGIPGIAGYDDPQGAYDVPTSSTEYTDQSMINGYLSDADIYNAIDQVKPVGTIVWTAISN